MEDFVSGKTGSGKPTSVNVPHLLDLDAASLTVASAKESESRFNPLDPIPPSLSIEDIRAMAESLVVRSGSKTEPPVKTDASPDEV